ncbi:MAG: VWA domain-containing protein [Pseudomonadales bacterium]|jgi:Ca-activated chloride channel family protein|nr:VWA domain-containing protein [Pseudomonadales bacterium]
MIELLWPWVFVLLPLPLVAYLALRRAGNRDPALHVPFFRNLSNLNAEAGRRASGPVLTRLCALLIWLALVVAASRPQWVGDPVQLPTNGRDLMLVIDVSGSMEAQDMALGGQAVNRLQITKSVVGDFVERRTGDRLGLILFAARAYTQAPLTFDRATVETLLYEAQIGIIEENATAIGDGIGLAVKRLKERPNPSRVIIMLTDGVNNSGEVSPLQAGELAAQEGIRVYTIGIGADSSVSSSLFGTRTINPSADLDEATLSKIAEITGGQYFRARDRRELENIYTVLDRLEPVDQDAKTFRPTLALFYWPLGAALALSLLLALMKLPWAQWRSSARAPEAFSSAALGGKR